MSDPSLPARPSLPGHPPAVPGHPGALPGHPPAVPGHPGALPGHPALPAIGTALPDAPTSVAPGHLLIGAGAAALVGGAFLTPGRPGLGWLLTALVLFGTAYGRHRFPTDDRRGWWRVAAGLAAVLLVADGAVRAAGWLFALCAGAAVLLVAYAVFAGRQLTDRSLLPGTSHTWSASPSDVARWSRAGLRAGGGESAFGRTRRIGIGLLIGTGLVVVFGALLTQADPAFADAVGATVGSLALPRLLLSVFVAAILLTGTLYLGYVAHTAPRRPAPRSPATAAGRPTAPAVGAAPGGGQAPDGSPAPRGGPAPDGSGAPGGSAVWALPLLLLDALFGWFIAVQAKSLYGGDSYVLRSGGPDYAVHARHGFNSLLTVAVLTAVVLGVVIRWAGASTRRDRATLRGLGGTLCVLTLAIVASAVWTMTVYTGAYGYTRTRLVALAFILWIGTLFVALLVAGIRLRAGWLPRAAAALAVTMLFGLVAMNPDRYIAHTVIARYDKDQHLDDAYLTTLSLDAAPEIATLPAPISARILWTMYGCGPRPPRDPWYAVNLSRSLAPAVPTGQRPVCGAPADPMTP